MRRPRIVVIGSCNVDLTVFTDRMPEPGETLFGRQFDLGFGGKGANQAVAARRCGADVAMVARVGQDLFGPATIENFRTNGVDASHVSVLSDASSGIAPILVEPSGQNRIVVVNGANDCVCEADVDAAEVLLEGADFLVLQFEIPLPTVWHALRRARSLGVRCVLNPAPAFPIEPSVTELVDYVIPNEREAEALTGIRITDVASAAESARRLVASGFSRVVVTIGHKGAVLASNEGCEHIGPHLVNALDTTGAGDAFVGSFVTFLAEGAGEKEAVVRASLYAALSTTDVGTQKSFPTRATFDAEWQRRFPRPS